MSRYQTVLNQSHMFQYHADLDHSHMSDLESILNYRGISHSKHAQDLCELTNFHNGH